MTKIIHIKPPWILSMQSTILSLNTKYKYQKVNKYYKVNIRPILNNKSKNNFLKGLSTIFLSDPPTKELRARFMMVPWTHLCKKRLFSFLLVLFLLHFVRWKKLKQKTVNFREKKHGLFCHLSSNKYVKGTKPTWLYNLRVT